MRQETTEDNLRDRLSMYEDLVSTIPVGVFRFTMRATGEWQFDFVNSRFCDLTGLNREDILDNYENAFRIIHPDDFPEFISLIESVEKNPAPFGWEGRIIVNGETRWVSLKSKPSVMDNRDIVWSGYFNDITERKRSENELRQSEARFRSYFELPLIGIAITSLDKNWLEVNPALCDMLGHSLQELLGMTWTQLTHPDDLDADLAQFNRMLAGQIDNYSLEKRFIRKNGDIVWANLSIGCVRKPDGAVEYLVALLQDITKDKMIENALVLSEAEKTAILNGIRANIAFVNDKLEILWVNNTAAESVGRSPKEMIGATCYSLWANPERPCKNCATLKSFQTRQPERAIMTTPDGRVWDTRGEPVLDDRGNFIGMVEFAQDITERKRVEEALKASEERYRQLSDVTFEGIIFHDQGVLLQANDQFFQMFGYKADELIGTQIIENTLTPDSVKIVKSKVADGSTESYMASGVRKDGTIFPIEIRARMRDINGRMIRATAIRDISRLKDLEAQLLQSQKMEALGTLVGGIAHDFNNMLQIILGYSDLLLGDKSKSEPGYDELKRIIETAEGGAELVKKLLAFGQQSPIFPVNLDLNNQVSQLKSLISRTLPEVVQVDLDLVDGPTTIQADPNQIDQMLMNLAINAAEAMPDGGRLKISTGVVSFEGEYCRYCNGLKQGGYVALSVMDNGRGMDRETQSRIFEPFFSTKQRGSTRGTGLGLSVVQGIAQQHGGHVDCVSEPGKGTEFSVYFPVIEEPLEPTNEVVPVVQSGGSETILVVEDNSPVAELEQRFLTSAGYTVIVAANGRQALDIYRSRREEISLVVLDLLMPEMSGRDCLMKMVHIDPSVKVLIASGYSPEDELHKEIRPLVRGFLHKPFSMLELLEKVRLGLDDDKA